MYNFIDFLMDFFGNSNPVVVAFVVFIFGAIFGSFINVLIYRLPLEMDIVFKPSFCPNCKNQIKWYHNIPIFSYLFLRGKCAYCGAPISISYLLVELFTACCFLLFYLIFGITWDFFVLCLFLIISFPVIVIDYKYHIIPDELSIGGAIIGILLAILHTFIGFDNNVNITVNLFDSLLGIFLGIIVFGGIYISSFLVFKKEGMGMGDVKFSFTIGAFLGSAPSAIAFLLSFLYGSLFGVIITLYKRIKNKRKIKMLLYLHDLNFSSDYITSIMRSYVYQVELDELKSSYIAFGPYMVLGAWTSIFVSNQLIDLFFGGII